MPNAPDFPQGYLEGLTRLPRGFVAWSVHVRDVSMDALHAHPELEVNLIQQGSGEYRDASGTAHPFREGDIILLPAGCDHRICVADETRFLIFLLHPERQPLTAGAQQTALPEIKTLRVIQNARAFRLLSQLHGHAALEQGQDSADASQGIALAHLAALVEIECARLLSMPAQSPLDPVQERIRAVQLWMEQNLHAPQTLAELANKACLSPSQFSARFRKDAGVSPMQYLKTLRLSQAAFLLRQTALPVLEIALSAGFNDLSHFHHQFRASYGTTPANYRKNAH